MQNSKYALCVLALSLALAHCGGVPSETSSPEENSPATDDSVGEVSQKYSQVGAERVIPIRFIVLDNFSAPCATQPNASQFASAIREANNVWLSAGVQFAYAGFKRYNTPNFKDPAVAPQTVTWASVFAELAPIDPVITSTLFAGQSTSYHDWTIAVSSRLPANQIHVWVPCSDPAYPGSSHSPYPWFDTFSQGGDGPPFTDNSRYMHVLASHVGNPSGPALGFKQSLLAHELGHYLGLTHTFDLKADPLHPSPDPFFYDMYFAFSNGIRVFSSAADLQAFDPGGNLRILKDDPSCAESAANGDLTCNWGGNQVKTSLNPTLVDPLGLTYQSGQVYGTNIMSYHPATAGAFNLYHGLGATQILRVKDALRSTRGKRNLLGRWRNPIYANRTQYSQKLDFDGDGKRDMAYWRASDRSCHIIKSSTGVEVVIPIASADQFEAEPVPADFDGDGKTDCAVFQGATGTGQSTWLWAASGSSNQIRTDTFGFEGEAPLAGTRLTANAGFGQYAVATKATPGFRWRPNLGGTRLIAIGSTGDDIMIGDYDGDGTHDFGVWKPAANGSTAEFRVKCSGTNYQTERVWAFGQETDVPLGAVVRDVGTAQDFALWRPSTGQWFYLLNPCSATFAMQTDRWGQTGDIPVPGWDMDRDGLADPVVYRPESSGGPTFYILNTAGGSAAVTFGQDGDVPFISQDADGDTRPELWLYRPNTADYIIALSNNGAYNIITGYRVGKYTDVPF